MDSNNQFNLTFADFLSFKPLVYARTKKGSKDHELKFIQVSIPVPNGSFCIHGVPKLRLDKDNKEVILKVVVDGTGNGQRAGHMLHFSYRTRLVLPKKNEDEFELIVLVKRKDDDRPPQVGKSVLKTIDEEE